MCNDRFDYLFILLIIIAGSLALFFKIGEIPPSYPWSDESEVAADAVETLKEGPRLLYPGQLAGGSLAVWLEAGWMALFGRNLLGLRLLNGLINLASVVSLYLLVRQLPFKLHKPPSDNRLLALMSGLLMAVSTWLLGLGRIAAPNWSLVPLLTGLAFYFFWRELNTYRRLAGVACGGLLGLLFYGYIPGYFVPLVPILFLILARILNYWQPSFGAISSQTLTSVRSLLPVMIVVAAPMLIFFAFNPAAALQRPLQLADTNELGAVASLGQGGLDMLSTFGLFPNWLIQANVEQLAFDPLVTVLFVVGLLVALRHWREPVYLFLLIWWGVMVLPALLSRSASLGFIFEVWRRGIGAQPVSFILAALGVLAVVRLLPRPEQAAYGRWALASLMVVVSAGSSYWLYFGRWANSSAIPSLFAAAPVRLVEWMEAEGDADTLFIFPIRPRVSPTTRPELFTVRYLYQGPAQVAVPVMDEATIAQTLTGLFGDQPKRVKLMMSERIAVDPKGYFEYVLGSYGQVVSRQKLPDYQVSVYRLRMTAPVEIQLEETGVEFGQTLRLVGQQIRSDALAAGQTLGVALRWAKTGEEAVDYNVRLTLHDAQGYERARVDQPLLSQGDYLTTRHWAPGTESTQYYTLPVPPDAPPGAYVLRVVAYLAETGEPLAPLGGRPDLSLDLSAFGIAPNPVAVDSASLAIARPVDAQISSGLRLFGFESSPASTFRPGDRLRVTLLWQATKPLTTEIGLTLALAVPEGSPIPLFERPEPLIAGYPTTEWPVGHVFRANYTGLLPATLETKDYGLALRLVDLATVEPVAEQVLAPISVEARAHRFEAPALANELNIDFSGAVRLRGFELGPFSPGQAKVNIKLQWQAGQEMSVSYKIFLHLVDAAGRVVSQVDTLPQHGVAPTTSWLPGEIIEDELTLMIPQEVGAGEYRLIVGLYDEKTGERLSVGQDDHVILIDGLRR